MAKATKKVVRKRREKKNVEKGAAHIRSTYNNTIVTIFPFGQMWKRRPEEIKRLA